LSSQSSFFRWPLDIPINITGNYGELRPNHFHAGLDFSTNHQINLAVRVAADGYVSRIKVSSGGYGKAVYVTHANGKVTLYAHLTNYNEKLNRFVKEEQYRKQNFEIEVFPKAGEFPFKGGDIIGYSGNTGSSGGPHLHFEIRDEKTEVPYNPALFYDLKDTEKPVIDRIAIYNLADTTNPQIMETLALRTQGFVLGLKNDSVTIKQSVVGLAFSGYDRFKANGGKNNIYNTKIYWDDVLIYEHKLDGIAFDDARYVNEFSEVFSGYKYQKCFAPTLFPAGMYAILKNKGRIVLLDTNYHKVQMVFQDENKNEEKIHFYLRTKKFNYYVKPTAAGDVYAFCNKDIVFNQKKMHFSLPSGTLYSSRSLFIENLLESKGIINILPSNVNLNKAAVVGFEAPLKYRNQKSKLVLKSEKQFFAPALKNDTLYYYIKKFGTFQLVIDTLAPSIQTELSAAKLTQQKKTKQIVFFIKDEISGIKSYNMYINGLWVLSEYDAKTNRLVYFFDDKTPLGKLHIKLEVIDRCDNKASFTLAISR
jgi:hypothetical protein